MEKRKNKASRQMLTAIFLAQVFSFICLCVQKYNMDAFSVNYRTVEAKSYQALEYLEEISSGVYEHETLVSRYIAAEDTDSMPDFDLDIAVIKQDVDNRLIECDVAFKNLEGSLNQGQYEEFKEAINAYFNCADIAIDTKKNASSDVALFLLNNNMVYYIDTANGCIEGLKETANTNLVSTTETITSTINHSRIVFVIGVIACFVTTIICMWYCHKMLNLQEDYMLQADEANMAKTVFLSNMSHEIRTPINAIIGLNEMITRESKDETVLGYARRIGNSSDTLLGLINDILDFSKIEANKMNIVPDNYRLDDMLDDLWDMISVRAKDKNLELSFEVNPKTPVDLYGDVVRIKQIIINILTNAVKYTERGSVTLKISFDKESADEILMKVAVKDTGIGIRPTDMDKLMNAFQRLDEKRNSNVEGTGLGLSIVDRLLKIMDSRLEVSSVYGEGSTFSFILRQPVTSYETIGEYVPQDRSEKEENVVSGPVFTASRAHILEVDDNAINRMVVEELLKRTRVQIDCAGGGQEAYNMCLSKKYDVIIMDHRMPGVDGIESYKMIRADGMNKETPVIMATANVGESAEKEYETAGFDGVLRKPIDGVDLETMIEKFLPEELLDSPEEQAATIDKDAGAKASGGQELYEKIVKEFVLSAHMTINEIEGLFKEGDIKNYTIKVHALKSTARMAGATQLSEEAKYLEDCGNNNNLEEITAKTPELIEHLKAVVEKLREEHNIKEDHSAGMIGQELLDSLLEAIIDACGEFDYDIIDNAMEEMDKYDLPESLTEKRQALKDAAFSMDIDETLRCAQAMKGGAVNE